jgi:hypothetical protein
VAYVLQWGIYMDLHYQKPGHWTGKRLLHAARRCLKDACNEFGSMMPHWPLTNSTFVMHKDPVLQGCYISWIFPVSLTSYLNRSLPLILDSHHVWRSSVWSQFLSAGKIISLGQHTFAFTHDDFRGVGMILGIIIIIIKSYHIIISPCVINYHFSIIMIRIISNEHGTGCFKQYVQFLGPRVQKPMIFPWF